MHASDCVLGVFGKLSTKEGGCMCFGCMTFWTCSAEFLNIE
jgi:hypothetical protein